MNDWIWALTGSAVTLAVAVAVILWHAFKHLDDKIDKKFDDQRTHFDNRFNQVVDRIAETNLLVAGHDVQIKAQEKQLDRLPWTVLAPPPAAAPGQHHDVEHASEPTAPAEAAAPAEGTAASAGGPEPTPPTAAVAPA